MGVVKFQELRLIAFGPFTNRVIEFQANGNAKGGELSGEPGIHVVFGHNEAGKSSALRAIGDLLFGFPQQTSDNFLHPNKQLRLGATLTHSDGRVLQFVRRKAIKSPLRDADDKEPLEEFALQPFLSGIDRATFESMYGLDSNRLLAGSTEILRGKGELGSALFAAGSGIAAVSKIQQQLETACDERYKLKGKNPLLNKQLSDLDEKRNHLKSAQLSVDAWESELENLQKIKTRKSELDQQASAWEIEKTQLLRIQAALPAISKRKDIQNRLASLEAIPALDESFLDQVINAQNDLKAKEAQATELRSELESLETERVGLGEPSALVAHAAEIRQFNERLGSHLKSEADKQTLNTQKQGLEQQSKLILEGLGKAKSSSDIEKLRVTETRHQRVIALAQAREAKAERVQEQDRVIQSTERRISKLTNEIKNLPPRVDTEPLRHKHRQLQPHIDDDHQIDTVDSQLVEIENEIGRRCRRLEYFQKLVPEAYESEPNDSAWIQSPRFREFINRPLPSRKTINDTAAQLRESTIRVESATSRLREEQSELAQVEVELQHLEQTYRVPSESELLELRQLRSNGWKLIQRLAHGQDVDDSECDQFLGEVNTSHSSLDKTSSDKETNAKQKLVEVFDAILSYSDELSDRLRNDADRVARKSEQLLKRAQLQKRVEELNNALELEQQTLDTIRDSWKKLWSTWEIEPLSPAAMIEWIDEVLQLREAFDKRQELNEERNTLRERVELMRQELNALADELQVTSANTMGGPLFVQRSGTTSRSSTTVLTRPTLREQWETIDDGLQSLTKQLERYESLEAQLEEERELQVEQRSRMESFQSDWENWQTDWQAEMEQLSLGKQALPEEATSTLRQLQSLFKTQEQIDDLERRIKGIDDDSRRFIQEVESFVTGLEEDIRQDEFAATIRDLGRRLEEAEIQSHSMKQLQQRLTLTRAKLTEVEEQCREYELLLSNLCSRASVEQVGDLADTARKGIERSRLESQRVEIDDTLANQSGGRTVTEFIEWVNQQEFDSDLIPARIDELSDQVESVAAEREELIRQIDRGELQLKNMAQGSDVAEASFEYQESLTRTDAAFRDWLVHRISALMLGQSLERYRDSQRGPVFDLASRYFSTLTCERYRALRVDLDEKGNPFLAGERATEETPVAVEAMSEGTRDQLFLALRFATLEQRLKTIEPIPLVFDDLFASFDDQRAVAGLKILTEVAKVTQVIFFTHHQHLVELAQENIPLEQLNVIEL